MSVSVFGYSPVAITKFEFDLSKMKLNGGVEF
jgi:O-phosphoseryl-tRNA(Cys) synthetase